MQCECVDRTFQRCRAAMRAGCDTPPPVSPGGDTGACEPNAYCEGTSGCTVKSDCCGIAIPSMQCDCVDNTFQHCMAAMCAPCDTPPPVSADTPPPVSAPGGLRGADIIVANE